jgi:hypothetical protein
MNMNTKTFGAAMAALLIGGITIVSAPAAQAQDLSKLFGGGNSGSRQTDKNNMRNLGEGLGGVAAYELLQGKGTNALILGAGAAYAGKKYEDERKAQAKQNQNAGDYRRIYRYRNGTRIGYDVVDHNGHRVSHYNRVYQGDHWTSRYQRG